MRLLGNQSISPHGQLIISGSEASHLREKFGTPLYVIDHPFFVSNIRRFRAAALAHHDDIAITYASKANGALAVLALVREEGLGIDVASDGELYGALQAGFEPDHIHLHGNFKSERELELATDLGIAAVMVDSIGEAERLQEIAARLKRTVRCILRLAPNVDPDTHEAIRTGQADTKFGLNIDDGSAASAARSIHRNPNTHLVGYHTHVGSQLLDSESEVAGARAAAEFAVSIAGDVGEPEEICVGGGLGIAYLPEMVAEPMETFLEKVIGAALTPFRQRPRLSFEPGRCLVGEPGTTLYTAGPIKEIKIEHGTRRYLSVDGGIADNPRPLLYQAKYHAINASRMLEPHDTEFRIASRHCENDTMIKSVLLPKGTATGDIIAVQCTGAYNFSMASNYNRFPRPAMVFVGEGEFLAVQRETIEQMFEREHLLRDAGNI